MQVWSQQLAGGHGKVFLGTTGLWDFAIEWAWELWPG